MKINFKRSVLIIALVTLFSCTKETTEQSAVTTASADAIVAGTKWYGDYIAYINYPLSRPIGNRYFIDSGHARIYTDTIAVHRYNYYTTVFKLYIPASKNIDADNVTLEAGVKNPSGASHFTPYYGRDIALILVGKTDSASINNVVPDSIRPNAGYNAFIQIGSKFERNIKALQYIFEDWGTLVIQTFNGGVVAYRNNEYLQGVPYDSERPLGKLREIRVRFKGSGYLDWIKLTDSRTGNLIMSEDFNTDGKSTVVWY